MTFREALDGVDPKAPKKILHDQVLLTIQYYSFDQRLHQGQLVLHKKLTKDIESIFALIKKSKFPIAQAVPISHLKFRRNNQWDDDLSMEANNSSAFNYRTIEGTKELSLHALGQAIDLNPRQNPFIRNGKASPSQAVYDPSAPGTFTSGSPIVKAFQDLGWEWGGNWSKIKDYHHFQYTKAHTA